MTTRDKAALRAQLAASHQIDFTADVHSLYSHQKQALVDMAKSVGYRKSTSSSLSLGSAFFVYLSKGAAPESPAHPQAAPSSVKRWCNHNIARG